MWIRCFQLILFLLLGKLVEEEEGTFPFGLLTLNLAGAGVNLLSWLVQFLVECLVLYSVYYSHDVLGLEKDP